MTEFSMSQYRSQADLFTAMTDHIRALEARVAGFENMVSEIAENLGVAADEGDVLIGIDALKARVEKLEEALRPFAAVCEHDIGLSEASDELFKPMSSQNARAPLLRVGHFRDARRALEDSQ